MGHVLSTLNRLPLLSEFALVILLAWVISGWLLPPQPDTQISNTMDSIEKTATLLPDLNSMLAVKLFGQPAQQPKPAAAVPPRSKVVIKRPLTLKLLGTVVAGTSSAAIISIKPGAEQQAYFIADTIQAGVILQSVEANAIVVNRGGSLERISLEEGGKLASSPLATTISTTPNQQPARSMNKTMSRAHLQKQLNNFPALLSQARAVPHFVNGKIGGFSVTNIVPGSLYQQAGLQNGDIIVSVNGEKITGAQQAMAIYTKLKSSTSLDLELIRAGGMQSIHYNIR